MLDWIAGILNLVGMWLVGNKKKEGFLILICCGILWMFVAFQKVVLGLLVAVIPLIFINTRNYFKWKKKQKNRKYKENLRLLSSYSKKKN